MVIPVFLIQTTVEQDVRFRFIEFRFTVAVTESTQTTTIRAILLASSDRRLDNDCPTDAHAHDATSWRGNRSVCHVSSRISRLSPISGYSSLRANSPLGKKSTYPISRITP